MAIRIQREVGGNLAETLKTTATTLREREALQRQVRTLSAEGRLSAYILIALPIGHVLLHDARQLRVHQPALDHALSGSSCPSAPSSCSWSASSGCAAS